MSDEPSRAADAAAWVRAPPGQPGSQPASHSGGTRRASGRRASPRRREARRRAWRSPATARQRARERRPRARGCAAAAQRRGDRPSAGPRAPRLGLAPAGESKRRGSSQASGRHRRAAPPPGTAAQCIEEDERELLALPPPPRVGTRLPPCDAHRRQLGARRRRARASSSGRVTSPARRVVRVRVQPTDELAPRSQKVARSDGNLGGALQSLAVDGTQSTVTDEAA